MLEISRLPVKNLPGFDTLTIVVAAIIIKDTKVLLYKQSNSDWKTIGGKLYQEESILECLKRETMEEIGCEIKLEGSNPLCIFNPRDREDNVLIFYYPVTFEKSIEEIVCPEGEVKWFEIEKLPENIYDSTKAAIKYFSNAIN